MSKLLEDRNLAIFLEILQNVHTDVVEDKLIFHHYCRLYVNDRTQAGTEGIFRRNKATA